MTLFEFLMMIAAVVVAVGMTEIIGGWGRLMRTRAAVAPDWLHIGWSKAAARLPISSIRIVSILNLPNTYLSNH